MLGFFRRLPSAQTVKTAAKVGTGVVAGLGAATTLAYTLLIAPWENGPSGKPVLIPYLDSGQLATACTGATGPKITEAYKNRKVFTPQECEIIDRANLLYHAAGVYRMVTYRPLPDLTGAAFISFAFNVGDGAFASSTLLKKANAGDLKGACEQLPRWVHVKGVKITGLEKRRFLGDAERLSERTVCMIGLDASYRTPLFDKLVMKVKY